LFKGFERSLPTIKTTQPDVNGLVALFIWIAENVGTFTAAWMYPNQRNGWSLVSMGKLGAWFLLMIISYTLVALLNRPLTHAASVAEPLPRPDAA